MNNGKIIPESECRIETLRRSGPGGQHRNKTETAVRITHLPSGLTAISSHHRSQHQNKLEALRILGLKLAKLRHKPKPRIATKASKASKQKRLDAKKAHSRAKTLRKRPTDGD